MKPLFFFLILLFTIITAKAQAPEQFSFQGVARGVDGKPISDVIVRLRVTIHSESLMGPSVYQEIHRPPTNTNGVFTIAIGKGNVVSGNFTEIPWKALEHFIQLEIDPTGGNDFINLGSTQLLSVPYALQAREATQWNQGIPVVQSLKLGSEIDPNSDPNDPKVLKYMLPAIEDGQTLIWYPVKGSFRAGNAGNEKWNDALTGQFSFATGAGTEASGECSAAFGTFTKASGTRAVSMGFNSEATGTASFSAGNFTRAGGTASVTFGNNVFSRAMGSLSIGSFNEVSTDVADTETEGPTDRIFQIGNGSQNNSDESQNVRKNALTLLRNGNLGLGKNALNPKYILEVDGRPRILHNGVTAGIHFDNSSHVERGFVGMKTDDEVGFFLDNWQLWVNNDGNAFLNGNVSLTSDARLKHNLSPLSGSLLKIRDLQGYHYNWIDKTKEQSLQTGLIAQQVEKLFPELVKTDANGFKSVNYIGLVPHLIESVKELNEKNELLTSQNQIFKEQAALIMSKLDAMEARLNASEQAKSELKTK
ncbi:tail fiber domain-containing protein [Dyadobacter sp. Leaf189]|uniref:tail fiber domain-containing protein n=1 Tax=Dyadobacter sp. Leaf189 TaxID=1736295 RepID=UPI0006F851CE|nr:tail fiber domain-containing protein [Dyadobacter sp. Leaf189]KQS23828.1 hypothetical protein ASG33_24735 [Dyadobacter sp. Leaf189]